MAQGRIPQATGPSPHTVRSGKNLPTLANRLAGPAILFVILFAFGVFGYYVVLWLQSGPETPGPSLRGCIYQTAILLTSVGFSDVLGSEHAWPSALFTVVMAFLGLGFVMYFISTVTAFIVGGELSQILETKKMHKRIARLEDHFIVCGGGETGRHVVAEFVTTHRPFVLIELDGERVDKLKEQGDIVYLQADASDDDILRAAGVERAQGLITTLPTDKDNLLIAITARQLNPKLRIISRCIDLDNKKKLQKAGADSVVAPNMIGGMRMVSEMVRPTTVTFLDTMLRDQRAIRFEDMRVPTGHTLVGQTLAEANFPSIADVNVIATRESEQTDFIYNPHGNLRITAGMDLVLVGSPKEIGKVRKHLQSG